MPFPLSECWDDYDIPECNHLWLIQSASHEESCNNCQEDKWERLDFPSCTAQDRMDPLLPQEELLCTANS